MLILRRTRGDGLQREVQVGKEEEVGGKGQEEGMCDINKPMSRRRKTGLDKPKTTMMNR